MSEQNNYDYLSEETGPEFGEVEVGGKKWKTLQLFHEDLKTRRGTTLQNGGFGIRLEDEPVPGMGKTWAVPFANNKKSDMITFDNFTAALIGWTEKYIVLKGEMPTDDGEIKGYFQPVPLWVNDMEIEQAIHSGHFPAKSKIRSTSALDLFFVLKGDPKRAVFRLRIKNNDLIANFAKQLNEARALGQKAKAPLSALWLEWKLAGAIIVGKAPNTAAVNGIELASKAIEPTMYATKDEYFGQVDEVGNDVPGLKARAVEVKEFLDDPADPYFIQAAKQLKTSRLPQLPAFAHLRLSAPQAQRPAEPIIEGEVTL